MNQVIYHIVEPIRLLICIAFTGVFAAYYLVRMLARLEESPEEVGKGLGDKFSSWMYPS